MNIDEQLKALILSRYGTLVEFANRIGMPQPTLTTILKRGIHNTSIGNVLKICKELQISADALARDKIVPVGESSGRLIISDIPKMIQYVRRNIDAYDDLCIDGKELSRDEWIDLLDGAEIVVEMIRKRRER